MYRMLSHISEILTAISQINEAIPSMFVQYFNVLLMEIPNMVMKFHNFDIFYQICYIFDLSSALTCRVESIKSPRIHQESHVQEGEVVPHIWETVVTFNTNI